MASPPSILIVDDNAQNRAVLTDFLVSFGHTSIAAEDGRVALARMARARPDLVLLDLMMPVMDGYEILDRMKSDPVLRHVPVVVISAVDEISSVVRCLERGADDYLVKPFNPALLEARVTASLEKARLRQVEERHRVETETALAMKTLLINIATHDLRNPLFAILGFVRFLREDSVRGAPLSAHGVSDLERVEQAALRMKDLLDTFLDVHQLHSGVLPMRFSDEHLYGVVSAVLADKATYAKE